FWMWVPPNPSGKPRLGYAKKANNGGLAGFLALE
ncbi:MAG: hypothetical protein RL733_728, partial [Actinomycetota bacterium]